MEKKSGFNTFSDIYLHNKCTYEVIVCDNNNIHTVTHMVNTCNAMVNHKYKNIVPRVINTKYQPDGYVSNILLHYPQYDHTTLIKYHTIMVT